MEIQFFKDLGDSKNATALDKEVSKYAQILLHAKEENQKLRQERNESKHSH